MGKKYELGTPLVEVPYLRVANVQGDHVDLSDVATIMVTPEEAADTSHSEGIMPIHATPLFFIGLSPLMPLVTDSSEPYFLRPDK